MRFRTPLPGTQHGAGTAARRACRSAALPAFAALLVLCAAAAVPAQECLLRAPAAVAVGDTARFSVECAPGQPRSFAWEIVAADTAESHKSAYGPSPAFSRVFRSAGQYLVFARVRYEDGFVESFDRVVTVLVRPTPRPPARSSNIVFDAAAQRLWVVNADNASVTRVDGPGWDNPREIPVGREPRTLAQSPDGSIWVTLQGEAALAVLDPATGALRRRIALPYASRPFAVAFSPTGDRAYVTLEGTGRLLALDPATGAEQAQVDVGPGPRPLAVSHDGKRVFAGRFISPADRGEIVEVDGAALRKVRVLGLAAETDPALDDGTRGRGVPNYLRALAISPDGTRLFAAAKKDNVFRGLARDGKALTFETSVRALLAVVDLEKNAEIAGKRLDIDNRSLPSALAFTGRGDLLFLATEGTDHVGVYEGGGLGNLQSIVRDATQPVTSGGPAPLDLAPDGLAVDAGDSLLFVHNFLSREVAVYEIGAVASGRPSLVKRIPTVARDSLSETVLLGKRLFYDAGTPRMTTDGYISCAVCHLEGGSDGRVWDFTDRGEGLRRTTSLLGRAGTGHGPLHWSANFDEVQDFEHDIRGPFKGEGLMATADFLHGTRSTPLGDRKAGVSPDLDALAAYLASLAAVNASPHRNPDGSMTAAALRGKILFEREDLGCAKCHAAPAYTDSRLPGPLEKPAPGPVAVHGKSRSFVTAEGFLLHDVGTLKAASGKRLGDSLPGLDTPTLKGIWETPPYLHDGSAATVLDVLTAANPEDRHGKTSHLSAAELADLEAFLLQLDETPPDHRVAVRKGAGKKTAGRRAHALRPGGSLAGTGPAGKPGEGGSLRDMNGRRPGGSGKGTRAAAAGLFVVDGEPEGAGGK